MVYKCYDEEGNYTYIETGLDANLQWSEIVFTPEGTNVGWIEFETIEDAMEYFKIKLKDRNEVN